MRLSGNYFRTNINLDDFLIGNARISASDLIGIPRTPPLVGPNSNRMAQQTHTVFQGHVTSICSKCFVCFRCMLQAFYLDIGYVKHICCKSMFGMFQLFSVLCCNKCFHIISCKCFYLDVAYVLHTCVQVYVPNVLYASDVCYIQVFHISELESHTTQLMRRGIGCDEPGPVVKVCGAPRVVWTGCTRGSCSCGERRGFKGKERAGVAAGTGGAAASELVKRERRR
jgi:hypothetical protein